MLGEDVIPFFVDGVQMQRIFCREEIAILIAAPSKPSRILDSVGSTVPPAVVATDWAPSWASGLPASVAMRGSSASHAGRPAGNND